jgi:hypothetical protein
MTSAGPSEPVRGAVHGRWVARLQATLAGHPGSITALAWGQLADRPVLASGGHDGTLRLWAPMIEQVVDRLPAYHPDDLIDPDRLGRETEAIAIALAELITARSARPPLAIGAVRRLGGRQEPLSRSHR